MTTYKKTFIQQGRFFRGILTILREGKELIIESQILRKTKSEAVGDAISLENEWGEVIY